MLKWVGIVLAAVLLLLSRHAEPAAAIPLFSHQYDVACSKCHSVVPHLNAFGAAFMASGDRIPGVKPGPAFPISTKINLVDSSEKQGAGPGGEGLPKAIVDEIELFTAGAIGSRASYFAEQYVVDGGMHGLTRDAWVIDRLNPWTAKIPLYVQAGSFTLPLPVDPETFRDSAQHYTVFDQAVGTNPFTFFDPKIGVRLSGGDPLRGLNVQVFAGPGHERQSGLPSTGTDVMLYAQDNIGPFALTAFRYAGARPDANGNPEQFQRYGYGVVYDQWGKLSLENVLTAGSDADCGIGTACRSSGGFSQLRYAFTKRLFGLVRYEGTNDPVNGFTRDAVILLGYGPSINSRFTIEDVITRTPATTHTMNAQYTIAY
jgi:hypothetical protein